MNLLLSICSIVWGSFYFGRDLFPLIFHNFYVFWGINIGLVILLAIGFAKSISIYFQAEYKDKKSFLNSALFLLLYLAIIIVPITVHYGMKSINTFSLSSEHRLPVTDTSESDTEEGRKNLAGFLFGQYGIKIPYKLNSDEYDIYKPTEKQIEKYNNSVQLNKEMLELDRKFSRLAMSSAKLAIIQIMLFFIVFVATIIYEQKEENNKNS